ncbi:MAG: glycosyltransferase [Gemmatimonadota bacterium]|nr:glycosyltransferase [Gemmatimonadota bacterium]
MADATGNAGRVNAISVVMPAWNAAATIGEALTSLRAQTRGDWEAVVVDDGSTDETAGIVAAVAAADRRVRLLRQPSAGAAAARNRGLAATRHPWLLFLDADDWILPEHLERLGVVLDASPDADAAVCGWTLVRDGVAVETEFCRDSGDLFPTLARRPAFAIHACLVARAPVEAVGGFDVGCWVHQDWLLWQRIARAGARFAVIRDPLAAYRLRDGSLTGDQARVAVEAINVIALGHGADPAVRCPVEEHAAGRPRHELTDAQVTHMAWPAGIEIARGRDACSLFDGVADGTALGAAEHVGTILARAAATVASPSVLTAPDRWPAVSRRLDELLFVMAKATGDAALPRSARLDVERRLLEGVPPDRVLSLIGSAAVEIIEPLGDLPAPAGVERLRIVVTMEGEPLGVVERPVIAGRVRESVVADAIADAFAWTILGRFLAHNIYSQWTMRPAGDGWSAWRGDHQVCAELPDDPVARIGYVHDRVGWATFLEEIWHPPAAPSWWRRFVHRRRARGQGAEPRVVGVEVSAPLPEVPPDAWLVLLAGGAVVAVVAGGEPAASPGNLRTRLTDVAGFELCRVVVREALLGGPLSGPTLRERLARASRRRAGSHMFASGWARAAGPSSDLAPGADRALRIAGTTGMHAVLGRHAHGIPGSSASRAAVLPADAYDALRHLAGATDTPLFRHRRAGPDRQPSTAIAYAPDVVAVPASHLATRAEPQAELLTTAEDAATPYGRHYFEHLFASGADPWRYETPYERCKYEQTLSLIGDTRARRALEVGCAEGHFTVRLAAHAQDIIAADISAIALARVEARCSSAGIENVVTRRLDLARDALPDGCDLIVCSEVLYYMGDPQALAEVAGRLVAALAPNGALVTAHAHVLADAPHETGFDWGLKYGARTIGETLSAVPGLALEREIRTPLYRIQRFRRLTSRSPAPRPVIEELPNDALPTGPAAARVRWGGSAAPMPTEAPVTTPRLPILMYHRIALNGAPERARYTVLPDRFEEQLAYLRDVGYRSATPAEWRAAVMARRPLDGRRVMLTFDDAYEDFGTAAWPLLRRYGFQALLFVVTGRVGMTNSWDPDGRNEPLLDWEALRALADEGVHIGSHTVSHPRLTSCAAAQIVEELARSRATIAERLGLPPMDVAYPWGGGGEDAVVSHLAGACGYVAGFTCRHGAATLADALLALPRLEVPGTISLSSFVQLFNP